MSFFILLTNPVPVDSVRSALEGREELWFICLLVASGGVAIGCVLEIPETWGDLKEWRKLRKESGEKPSWRVPMGAIGLLLVVMGVIGEGVFEALVSMNETALRAHDEQVLGETIKEAGTAKDSANAAVQAAALASKVSGEAMDKASAVFSTAASANESARGALTLAGDAKAGAEKANAELADRSLSDSQVAVIGKALAKFPGQEYKVVAYWDSHESIGIANRIHQSLQVAHWKYLPPPSTGIALMGGIVGVQVWHHPDAENSTKEAASLLIKLL
jgi:hypothetical protein